MTLTHSYIPNAETIKRAELSNGITVLVYENPHVQSVVVSGSLDVGSIYEPVVHNGLTAMVATATTRGTENRDFDTLHSALEDVGADLRVSGGRHKTRFGAKSLAEDLPLLVELLADVLRNPSFPEDQVERLRGEWLTGLQYRLQDTGYLSERAFRRNLYPEVHPYHYSLSGTLETVPTITRDVMYDYHLRYFGPRGMIIVIVGAVQADETIDLVRRYFEDWHNADQPEHADLPDLTPIELTQRVEIDVPGKMQTDIMIGSRGPSRMASDFRAASLANSVLGQFGMMGRIGDVVREREGMAYYAGSSLRGGYGPGAWSISAGVDPQNIERTIDLCIEEVRRITTEPISDDDLADNLSYFAGRLPLQLENNEGLAATILTMESYQLGLNYLLDYRDTLYRITKDDVLKAAQRYLNPSALVISVAGPKTIEENG